MGNKKMTILVFVVISGIFILLVMGRAVSAGTEVVTRSEVLDVAKEIHPPGCTDSMTADYCQIQTAYEVRGEIRGLLEDGNSKQVIIDKLVTKYGDRILASPKKEGFNLFIWAVPGVSVAAGGFIVLIAVRRFAQMKKEHSNTSLGATVISEEQEEQIQKELKSWL